MILNMLIFISGAVLLLSTGMALYLWYGFKHPLLKELVFFWLSGILSFVAQGLFPHSNLFGFLAFSINWMTVIFMLKILAKATETELPFRRYHQLLALGVLTGVGLFLTDDDFTKASVVFCIACAFVMIHGALKHFKVTRKDSITNGYRALIVLDAIHFLDYPLIRPVPEYAILGFSFTLIFFFCFAIFIPIFILQKISQDYNKELVEEVATRTVQLRESNAQLNMAFENLKKKTETIDLILK